MAVNVLEGLMGAGKTYVAVNRLMADFLRTSDRHIFTNLPINLDSYVAWLSRNPARQAAYRERIHFLDDIDLPPGQDAIHESGRIWEWPKDDDGKPLPLDINGGRGLNPARHFWRFTPSGAVVFLDEVADLWPSAEWKDHQTKSELASFIQHHRHYKYDLYFFAQEKDDISTAVRKKLQYSWLIENSKYRNIAENWMLRGLRWPVQFFFVRCDLGKETFGMNYLKRRSIAPQLNFVCFPKARAFQNYDSFSRSEKIKGKGTETNVESSDTEVGWWPAVKNFVSGFGLVLGTLVGAAVGLFMAGQVVWGMMHVSSADVHAVTGSSEKAQVAELAGGPGEAGGEQAGIEKREFATTQLIETNLAVGEWEQPEQFIMATPEAIITTKGHYRVGSILGGRVVYRITPNGTQFVDGERAEWAVLFPGGRRSGRSTGGIDRGTLAGVGSGASPGGLAEGVGAVGRR